MAQPIIIYTDGSAKGNPGPGGYGAILMSGDHQLELSEGYRLTTNNRMELMAVIAALQALKKENLQVEIYSDSQYVVKAVKEGWLKKWMATDFRGGKKNADLWRQFHQLSQKQHLHFHWVKGHADNEFNNRCDQLATSAAAGQKLRIDKAYEETLS
jgi:ribonuclease HI